MPITSEAQPEAAASSRLYRAVWRWHFYAGLYVIPFLMMLAITGFFMMLFTTYLPEHGDRLAVTPQAQALPATQVAEAARASLGAEALVAAQVPQQSGEAGGGGGGLSTRTPFELAEHRRGRQGHGPTSVHHTFGQ